MKKILLLFLSLFLITSVSKAQFKDYTVKTGIQYQQLMPLSEFKPSYSFIGRVYLGFELNNIVCLDICGGFGQYKTDDDVNVHSGTQEAANHDHYVKTDIVPFEARLRLSPFASANWNPYFYLGVGLTHLIVKEIPENINIPDYEEKKNIWTFSIPGGFGTEIKMSDNVLLDLSAGAAYYFSDEFNNFNEPSLNDAQANLTIGLTFTGNSSENDNDKDGLLNDKEEEIGTNPDIADTDGDGLQDGAEVNQYRTNPLNKDTDGDTLMDGEEVMRYTTDPLNKDTDSDRLMDNEELNQYLTLPKDNDTDDDNLKDGEEVLTYRTDPKQFDTDKGTIWDGVEVGRGTDPLNPNDDLPPAPKEEPIKIGTVIVLEGINFASGSAEISGGSDNVLEKAYISMRDNPDIVVEISGHTDSRGGRDMNMNLSRNRAESVKSWLVARGISSSRIETVGYGPDKPIDSNDTDDGRYRNRRIEFKRIR